MKMFSKKKNPATYDEKYLVEEINMTKAALSAAYANFDNATDPDLIDCYIYQLNSEQKRYKYLLQKAKENNPKVIIITSPQMPTGCGISYNDIEKVIRENTNSVILLDEAYWGYGNDDNKFEKKIITQNSNEVIKRTC